MANRNDMNNVGCNKEKTPLDIAKKTWQYPLCIIGLNIVSFIVPVIMVIIVFALGFSVYYTIFTAVNIFSNKEAGLLKHFIPGVLLNIFLLVPNLILLYYFVGDLIA